MVETYREPAALAPWVVSRRSPEADGPGHYLLGPSLTLLHISAEDLDALCLDVDTREMLDREGFIASASPPTSELLRREIACASGRVIVAPECIDEAMILARALHALDPDHPWAVCEAMPESTRSGPRGMLLVLGHREAIDPAPIVCPMLAGWTIVWCGESSDGPHVGPRFEAPEQVPQYVRASLEWSSCRSLLELGFAELPLTVTRWIRRDPRAVARAVLEVAARPSGACVRLRDGSVVVPWTFAAQTKTEAQELFRSQDWSKGLLRDYVLERSEDSPLVYFGTCSTPCGADPVLEGNFGKGMTEAEARITTIGEAVERFGAYASSVDRPWAAPVGPMRRYALQDFHPFGPAYHAHLERGAPPVPLTAVWDAVSRSPVAVPRALVPMPYRPEPHERAPTGSTSAGLAAYPDRDGAVLRGALEVLERHNLYRPLLQLEPGERIDPRRLPRTGRHDELMQLVGELERLGFALWLVRYPSDDGIPIVHAFVWEASITTMSRGTGSGTCWSTAALKAVLETMQLRLQHQLVREQGVNAETDPGYVAWSRPDVGAQLVSYLDGFATARDAFVDFVDEAQLFARIVACNEALLVAELPCPVRDWSVVHVLIPGATCVCEPSASAGGRALMNARFRHPIPI